MISYSGKSCFACNAGNHDDSIFESLERIHNDFIQVADKGFHTISSVYLQ